MGSRSNIVAIALLLASGAAVASTNDYQHLGKRPASGEARTAFYAFTYEEPSPAYKSMGWNAYSDKREVRNLAMVTGMTGYDTYALSVLYQGAAAPGQGTLALAQARHPNMTFSAGPNPRCVNTPLERPFQLIERMAYFMAVCVDKDTLAIYELGISWKSLLLAVRSLDDMLQESADCVAAKAASASERCVDQLGWYTRSFRTFLTSFSFTGT